MTEKRKNMNNFEFDANYIQSLYDEGYLADGTAALKRKSSRELADDYMREQEEKARLHEHRRKHNFMHANRVYTFYMVIVVLAALTFMVKYIDYQSVATIKLREISSLETQLEDLRADNDATAKRLASAVPIYEVKERAINELGMDYARDSQIRYYSVDNVDYMSQYADLP